MQNPNLHYPNARSVLDPASHKALEVMAVMETCKVGYYNRSGYRYRGPLVHSIFDYGWSALMDRIRPLHLPSVGAKDAESGGQIRRPFHSDVQFLRNLLPTL